MSTTTSMAVLKSSAMSTRPMVSESITSSNLVTRKSRLSSITRAIATK